MLVKFANISGGVFIEVTDAMERTGAERCFRFDPLGNSEFAYLSDLQGNNPAPRWYGHIFKERDFTFA